MRGFRVVPLVVVTVAVVVAVAVAVAGQGMRAVLAESPGLMHSLGGTVAIILAAALATLPLVTLLVYLRGHPLRGRRPALGLDRRRLALGLGVALIAVSGGTFVFGELGLDDPARALAVIAVRVMVVIGFLGYALALTRFVRWVDGRLLRQTPS